MAKESKERIKRKSKKGEDRAKESKERMRKYNYYKESERKYGEMISK
jgi:hypothetical protein